MELEQQMLQNGQELQTGDVSNMGLSAIMDDRVLADILRLGLNTAGTVSKAILPYGTPSDNSSTVTPTQSANGSVYIAPFRAVVGATALITGVTVSDALNGWRDIRSGVFAGGEGVWNQATSPSTSLVSTQAITANAAGQARWDVIYAIITPNASQPGVPRAVKSPTSGAVTTPTTVVQLATTVSIGYTTGTPSASPALPAIPADAGGVYYVALAYIVVPNGFGATSTVMPWQIWPVASPGPSTLARGLGGANLGVPNQSPQSSSIAAWANNSTSSISGRPNYFLTQEMRGKEELLVAIVIPGSSSTTWSVQNGGIIDNSRDWRNRIFKTTLKGVNNSNFAIFPWSRAGTTTRYLLPSYAVDATTPEVMAQNLAVQLGQSFLDDGVNLPGASPPTGRVVCYANNTVLSWLSGSCGIGLYVDDSGVLRAYINVASGTTPIGLWFFWVEASGPMGSY